MGYRLSLCQEWGIPQNLPKEKEKEKKNKQTSPWGPGQEKLTGHERKENLTSKSSWRRKKKF